MWAPIELELIGFAGGFNNSYAHPKATSNQPLNDNLTHDIPRIF